MLRPRLSSATTIVALAFVSFAASCGGGSQPSSPGGSPAQSAVASTAAATSWDQVVAASKREGQLAILSEGGNIPDALIGGFKKKFPDVAIDNVSGNGGELETKLLTERQAGRYGFDIIVHGTTTLIDLAEKGALGSLPPNLVGPDVQDQSKWRGGAFTFADDAGQYDLMYLGGVNVPMIFNPSLVGATDVKSYRDLLQPKWKGKLAMIDPRVAGPGLAMATFLYVTPSLGKEYLKQLVAQGVIFNRDGRLLTDWVGQAKYPIAVGADARTALDFKKKGVPVQLLPAEALQEGSYVSAGQGSVGIIDRAPHPSTAKVYLNWLLSKEGQEVVSAVSGYPSRRLDALSPELPDFVIPKPGVEYQENSKQQYVRLKDDVVKYVKDLIES